MTRILATAGLALAPGAQAETVRSDSFIGEIQRRDVTLRAQDGTGATRASQIYVSGTTASGAVLPQGHLQAAGVFAASAGCRDGAPLGTILAGVTAPAAEFEVFCQGGR